MKTDSKYGFKEPVIKDDQYFLGGIASLPKVVLRPDGQWDDYLPTRENQLKKFETYNCTSFGTLNCYETLFNFIRNSRNFSDRFVGINAGTTEAGNDPHTAAQAIRHEGLIPEEMLPFSDELNSLREYYSFKGGDTIACMAEGQRFLSKFNIGHEWVFQKEKDKNKRIELMKEALQYSPLGVSVTAWMIDKEGLCESKDVPNNHWTMCFGYLERVGETYFKIFDSYDNSFQILHPDHVIRFCKRYHLQPHISKPNWLKDLFMRLKAACGL